MLGYLESYARHVSVFDLTLRRLDSYVKEFCNLSDPKDPLFEGTEKVWLKMLEEKPIDEFLLMSVLKVDSSLPHKSDHKYKVDEFACNLFGGYNSFEEWLKEYTKTSSYKSEFLLFMDKYRGENFRPIRFTFEDIPVHANYVS